LNTALAFRSFPLAIFPQRLEVLFKREGVHDVVVLLAESQRTVAAEVAVGLSLADLALSSKGGHKQDEVFYLIKNGCRHHLRYYYSRRKYTKIPRNGQMFRGYLSLKETVLHHIL
jgi:hypothetical protein